MPLGENVQGHFHRPSQGKLNKYGPHGVNRLQWHSLTEHTNTDKECLRGTH